jgi:hypothetical protein
MLKENGGSSSARNAEPWCKAGIYLTIGCRW